MSESIILTTAQDTLIFDAATGRLMSLRSKAAPDQEFVAPGPEHPVFVIGYLDADRQYRLLGSTEAEEVAVEVTQDGGRRAVTMSFRRLAGQDLAVTCTVDVAADDPCSHWGIRLDNRAGKGRIASRIGIGEEADTFAPGEDMFAKLKARFAEGPVAYGKEVKTPALAAKVAKGDVLLLVVEAKIDHTCDMTGIAFSIFGDGLADAMRARRR